MITLDNMQKQLDAISEAQGRLLSAIHGQGHGLAGELGMIRKRIEDLEVACGLLALKQQRKAKKRRPK
jgi:hypothetical protein